MSIEVIHSRVYTAMGLRTQNLAVCKCDLCGREVQMTCTGIMQAKSILTSQRWQFRKTAPKVTCESCRGAQP